MQWRPRAACRCYLISERGADPNRRGSRHFTALLAAVANKTDHNDWYLINEAGADVNAQSLEGATSLMMAAAHGKMKVLKALVAKGANVGAVMNHGGTVMGCAVEHKRAEATLYLLEEVGAAWGKPYPSYFLVVAAQAGFSEFVKPLLRHMRSKGLSDGDITELMAHAAFDLIRSELPIACLKLLAEEGEMT